ncbi:hypothetical protein [Parerythrobacter aestuarii]|uniref:hypothetical protein n=1 Tax=Parerythrobacter aestuarii TaxID=3020909 RepID=UPI0024DE652B|nr:hypothetical protein [Parerythrobacter aestuarii]
MSMVYVFIGLAILTALSGRFLATEGTIGPSLLTLAVVYALVAFSVFLDTPPRPFGLALARAATLVVYLLPVASIAVFVAWFGSEKTTWSSTAVFAFAGIGLVFGGILSVGRLLTGG